MNPDSIQEAQFYERQKHLLDPVNDLFYPTAFTDSDGNTFDAKPDFTYQNKIWVESKCHQLNNQPTKAEAERKYAGQLYRMNPDNRNLIQLKYQWHHSRYKQGIIARAYPNNFLLVFKDGTKLSTQARNRMAEEGITWCFESNMEQMLLEMMERLS